MSLDLQKNIVLVGIGGCVVLLLIVRAAEGPQTESETPPMPASEEGASPQSPSPGPGAGGDPSDAATERVEDGEQRNAEALEDTGPSAATDAPRAEDGTELAVVEELGIASDMEHPFMEGCVSNVFSDLWFSPPPDGRLEVTYPISFRSS